MAPNWHLTWTESGSATSDGPTDDPPGQYAADEDAGRSAPSVVAPPPRRRKLSQAELDAELLGVPLGAPPSAIKAAWRAKITEAHPDAGGSEEQAKLVNAAYQRLKEQQPHV